MGNVYLIFRNSKPVDSFIAKDDNHAIRIFSVRMNDINLGGTYVLYYHNTLNNRNIGEIISAGEL